MLAKNFQMSTIKSASNKTIDWKEECIKEVRGSLGIPATEPLVFKAEARMVSSRVPWCVRA